MSSPPQFWVIGGPNGAGKSTLADRWLRHRIPVISPDTIALECEVSPIQAGKMAVREQNRLLDAKKSFAIDTTFSGNRETELMQRALESGYKVNLVFVCMDSVEICLLRVAERVANGGHSVPPSDVVRRYGRSLENLQRGIDLADRTFLFDNTDVRRRLLLSFEDSRIKHISREMPSWVERHVPSNYLQRASFIPRVR